MNRVDCIKLIRSFIDEKLDGNIENFLNYDLDQLENDEKYGGFDPDNSKIANAIYVVLWGDKIPDLNYDALGTSYRGDILNSFNTLMGRSTEDQTNFVGIQKYTDNPQIIEMAKEYHKKYHTIGNMTIWPNNSVEYSEIWKEYEDDDTRNDFKGKSFTFNTIRSQSPWYDYFDAFLEIIKEQLTAPKIYLNGSAYSVVCELMYGKTLETQFFEDFFYLGGMEKFENFIHTFYYENYVDMENMEIQQIFSPHAYHWRNSYKKEEYEKYVSSYITKATEIIEYRGSKMIEELKKALQIQEPEKESPATEKKKSKAVSYLKELLSCDFLPKILLGIVFMVLCIYSAGSFIRFLIIGGYNIPDEVRALRSPYHGKEWLFNSFYIVMLLAPFFMCRVYKKENTGFKKIIMSLLVVIQEIMIIFPIILFVLWKILICCSKFVPILLKEAYGILELVNAAGVLYLGIHTAVVVISIIVLAIEEDYRDFSKYWGILWLLFIFVFPLILKVLSVKPLAILIGIVAVGFIIVVLILNGYDAVKYRCPACKKFNGLSYVSSKLLREDDISIQVQNQIKNAEGKVIGTQDQYIPGKRKMYEETYKCANYGYVNKKLVTKDVKLL